MVLSSRFIACRCAEEWPVFVHTIHVQPHSPPVICSDVFGCTHTAVQLPTLLSSFWWQCVRSIVFGRLGSSVHAPVMPYLLPHKSPNVTRSPISLLLCHITPPMRSCPREALLCDILICCRELLRLFGIDVFATGARLVCRLTGPHSGFHLPGPWAMHCKLWSFSGFWSATGVIGICVLLRGVYGVPTVRW